MGSKIQSGDLKFPFPREQGADPPPLYEHIRHSCPVVKVSLFDGSEAWLVTKAADIRAALQSSSLSADRRSDGYPEIHDTGAKAKEKRPTFVNLDDPHHKEQRAMIEPFFTKQAVEEYRPFITELVHNTIDNMLRAYGEKPESPVDFIEAFAQPIPTKIVYNLLGVPKEDIDELTKDSEVRTSTSRDAAQSSNKRLQDYIGKLVDARVKQSAEGDVISHLVKHYYTQGKLTKEDVANLAFLVLVAGNAALINAIALGVVTLLLNPSQLNVLKAEPRMSRQAVDEILRYHTVSGLNSRRAAIEDIEIGGQQIKRGEGVICAVQSGDRDKDKWDVPNAFSIARSPDEEGTLGFGWGPHRCQGEWLSRLELEITFATLFARLPNLRLAVNPDDIEYTLAKQNVGIVKLPVLW